jgi:peptide/nickel transport system substrate-binding protein
MPDYWTRTLAARLSRRRALSASGVALAGAALVAACGGNESDGAKDTSSLLATPTDTTKQAKRSGVLKRNFNSDFPSLDPSQNYSGSSGLYETVLGRLVGFKPGFQAAGQEDQIAPDVAESWEFSPDRLQITFKLRPNVKFHNIAPVNGRVIDVDDVVFSWDRFARTGGQRSGVANAANPNAPILSVTAADARTIVVKLKDPLAYALGMFGARENINLVPKEGADTGALDLRNKMISTGPYFLAEYQRSVGFTLKRNEDFYDKSVAFVDQIDLPIVSEYAAAAAQFRNGNIHASFYAPSGTVGFNIRQEEVLATKTDVPELNVFSGEVNAIGNRTIFGWKTAALRDERVRQAFSMAHDRDLWIEVWNNASKFEASGLPIERRWYSPFPSVASSYDGWRLEPRDEKSFGPNAKYFKHDVAEAKKLLSAAGFAGGLEMPSTFLRGTEYGVDFHRQVEVRQGFLTDAGIKFQNFPVDYQTEFIPKYRDSNGNFEGISYRSGPPATSGDPVAQMHYWYHSKAGASFFGYDAGGKGDNSGDPYVDSTISKAQQEFDTEKRKALIVELVKYLGGKMYSLQGIGGASNFSMAWPAVQNVNVWLGGSANSARIPHLYWWLDDTKPPLRRA